jgi:predicted ATP-binding protein involved in virulence
MITRIVVNGYRLFRDFDLEPTAGTNIIVGDNEAGKSTLLEAVALALTGRINGRWAQDELNPYWFNQEMVQDYFKSLKTSNPLPAPEILIELYLNEESDQLQSMLGVHNSRREKVPGLKLHISPSEDYAVEFDEYMADENCPELLPTEWYRVEWTQFSDDKITQQPKHLGISIIDSRTVYSSAGVDYHTREMLAGFIEPKERAKVAIEHRRGRHAISTEILKAVNERISATSGNLHDRLIGLHMDQSSNAAWQHGIVPQVADIPFAMAGQGQQAAIKIALAMHRKADTTAFALIEEPENHLSHTSLMRLVARIEALAGERQIFLTTHSSYVLNRLGLDKLVLLHKGLPIRFKELDPNTVAYFKKLSGYNTLRLVLAEKVVLVEGPSDEMVFEHAFRAKNGGQAPMDLGVDVLSLAGVSFSRALELCSALKRSAAGIRDNDGNEPDYWQEKHKAFLEAGTRELFIGDIDHGDTLETQFVAVNDVTHLRKLFDLSPSKPIDKWMKRNKTSWSLRLDESKEVVNYPKYIVDAVEFVS